MIRKITGYHLDDENHWVAELACFHGQHQRHNPPMISRPWVMTGEGRKARIGTTLNCLRCDRRELPEGLTPGHAAIEVNADTQSANDLQARLNPVKQWTLIRVISGSLNLVDGLYDNQPVTIAAGEEMVLVPGLSAQLEAKPAAEFVLSFFEREQARRDDQE